MYEMQGTLPGLAAAGQPVAWPSRRERAARQSQEPALGSGCPAPPTSRGWPRAVPVSNGESISTASAQGRARPGLHLFPAFFRLHRMSTEYGRLSAFRWGFPPSPAQVIHRLPGVTCRDAKSSYIVKSYFRGFSLIDFPYPRRSRGDYPVKFGRPFSAGCPGAAAGVRPGACVVRR